MEKNSNTKSNRAFWFIQDKETWKEVLSHSKIVVFFTLLSALAGTMCAFGFGVWWGGAVYVIASYLIGVMAPPRPLKDYQELGAFVLLSANIALGALLTLTSVFFYLLK